jgi:catechol 2,3-dioxygenase-like lactoylglutathione lyase family enzyme
MVTADLGLTHVALPVHDVDASAEFYARYADMEIVHRRVDHGVGVTWLSDLTRPFVIVLLQTEVTHVLGGWAHLGVACESREEVDRRIADARERGIAVSGPYDEGPPVGYWAILPDPDGHHLELAYGQEVGTTVRHARHDDPERSEPGPQVNADE